MNILDASDHKTNFASVKTISGHSFWCKYPELIYSMGSALRFRDNPFTAMQRTFNNPNQRNYTKVVVESGINNQRLQRCLGITLGWRYQPHQLFQQLFDTQAGFGADLAGILRFNTDDVFDFLRNAFWL